MNDTGPTRAMTVGYELSEANLFFRDQPARDECPAEFWDIARKTIDHGSALLLTENKISADRRMRDLVRAALMRRALVVAEGIVVLLECGLMEPAVALGRVLLDIELNFKLVTNDATERMAKRLAAYHFLGGQRHGQKMLSNRESRERMAAADDGHLEWTKDVAKSLAKDFQSAAFDDVRADIKPGQPWHGMNVEDAFRFAGLSPDYYQAYDLQTFFVHTSNIDFDFLPGSEEKPALRSLVDRDPERIGHVLGLSILRLHRMMQGFAGDRSSAELKSDNLLEVDSLTGLGMTLAEVFTKRLAHQ